MAHTVSLTDLQCQLAALPPDFYSAEAAPLTDTPSTLFAVLQAEAPQSITYDNIKRRPSCIAILRLRRNAVFVPRVVTDAILDQVASGFAIANTAICQSPAELQPEVKSECVTLEHGSCTTDKKSPKGYSTRVNNILDEWTARNKANPYPTPQDKLRLMRETGLTKMQLKNWLCNIRRRKLPNTIRRPKKDVRIYRR
ncbi:hypothetical protein GGF44_006407 [Coemansia sp. RSA 1694]|nr:hypothetical protein GGF44_006407 [Coemansia sp. RSA 1694]